MSWYNRNIVIYPVAVGILQRLGLSTKYHTWRWVDPRGVVHQMGRFSKSDVRDAVQLAWPQHEVMVAVHPGAVRER